MKRYLVRWEDGCKEFDNEMEAREYADDKMEFEDFVEIYDTEADRFL